MAFELGGGRVECRHLVAEVQAPDDIALVRLRAFETLLKFVRLVVVRLGEDEAVARRRCRRRRRRCRCRRRQSEYHFYREREQHNRNQISRHFKWFLEEKIRNHEKLFIVFQSPKMEELVKDVWAFLSQLVALD